MKRSACKFVRISPRGDLGRLLASHNIDPWRAGNPLEAKDQNSLEVIVLPELFHLLEPDAQRPIYGFESPAV